MRIAILGAHGQLGSDLCQLLGNSAVPMTHQDLDITDPAQIDARLLPDLPDALVNCAAYNGVEQAETDFETAFRQNSMGPSYLAKFCQQHQRPFVHISTDYVFGLDDQRKEPYLETDLPGPLGVYAVSKLAGEELVRAGCRQHLILRTCGLYGHRGRSGKKNFVETMLSLGQQKQELRIIGDQQCTPTSTADLSAAIVALVGTQNFGTYHATNSESCSWAEFATEIFRLAKLPTQVIPITTAEYGAKVRRPPYSVLNCSKLAGVIGKPMRSWKDALADYLTSRAS